jgi:hypothetical protein
VHWSLPDMAIISTFMETNVWQRWIVHACVQEKMHMWTGRSVCTWASPMCS